MMMRCRSCVVSSILLHVVVLASPALGAAAESFDSLKQRAQADGAIPENRAYLATLVRPVRETLDTAFEKCEAVVARVPLSSIEIVITIGADGRSTGVAVNPESESMRCIGGQFRDAVFSKPPHEKCLAYLSLKPADD